MPEFGVQVYWHEIPGCPAPWSNEVDRQRMWGVSQSVVGNISDMRHMATPSRSEVLLRRHIERAKKPNRNRHWGVVLEPFLSPLHGLNMVMKELRVAAITREEAADAVAMVEEDYKIMTQQLQQPSQSQASSQARAKVDILTQQSNAPAMDIKLAPLLEVVKVFCARRGLHVSTFSKADLRLKGRIGVADVLPRRRVVMAFDHSKPHFVFAMAVETRGKHRGSASQARYIQVVAPTSNPFPWRRLIMKRMGYLPPSECVVVAVQRQHDDDGPDGLPRVSEARMCDELLIGGDDEDDEWAVEQPESGERNQKGHKRARQDERDKESATESSDTDESALLCESEGGEEEMKIYLGPTPIFKPEDQLLDDPLFETPVASLRKTSRKRLEVHDWVQRLIEHKERKQLYDISHLESDLIASNKPQRNNAEFW